MEQCEDSWAVYYVGSGITHLVDFMSGEVLLFLSERPRTEVEICALLGDLLGEAAPSAVSVRESLLTPLLQHQLIEPYSCD